MKKIMLIGLLLLIICSCVDAEELEFTGYYPSPKGVYQFLELILYGDTSNESISPELSFKRANTTESPGLYGSPIIGRINFQGHTGVRFETDASIFAKAHSWVSTGENTAGGHTDICFQSKNPDDGILQDRMVIRGDGCIGIGTTGALYGKLTIEDNVDGPVIFSISNPNNGPSSDEEIEFRDNDGNSYIRVNDNTHSTNPSEMGILNGHLNGKIRFKPSRKDGVQDQDVVINTDGSMQFRNMPGVAFNNYFKFSGQTPNPNWATCTSLTIDIPADGYVLISSTGSVFAWNGGTNVLFGISEGDNTVPIDGTNICTIDTANNTLFELSYSVNAVFSVQRGLKTFYLVRQNSNKVGGNGSIQAMYFPVCYNTGAGGAALEGPATVQGPTEILGR